MPNLIGYAYQTGTIEFDRKDNPWAFRRLDDEMKQGQENRIRFDPKVAPVEVRPSPNVDPASLKWLEGTQQLLQTASMVYLQRTENTLRFRLAIHQISKDKSLVTIGSQAELIHYAAEHWNKIHTMYALRHIGFQFDIDRLVVRDRDLDKSFGKVEVHCRIRPPVDGKEMRLGFDCTGTNSHADLISWRATVDEGVVGKLAMNEDRIALNVTNYQSPFSFCDEYHPDTHYRWYLFSQETVKRWYDKACKLRKE
jgi:hypothetical protein